jgi:DNA-binding LacI/PurR family transcriptional regulator
VRVPAYEMGQRAAAMLIDRLDGKGQAERQVVLPVDLCLRESA